MNKKEKLAFAFVAALAMTSGGFAFGQSVNNVSSDQVIYACVTGVNGNITKVSNTPKTCPKGTTPISWNMVGPKGDQGLQGPKGDKGERGEQGLQGKVLPSNGSYVSNEAGEYVADVVSFNAVTGIATINWQGSYWYFSLRDGVAPALKLNFAASVGSGISFQYFSEPDCKGVAFYPSPLRASDYLGYRGPWQLYTGVSLSDISGLLFSDLRVAYESDFMAKDMKSHLWRNEYEDYFRCESFQSSNSTKMFEFRKITIDVGQNLQIVSHESENTY